MLGWFSPETEDNRFKYPRMHDWLWTTDIGSHVNLHGRRAPTDEIIQYSATVRNVWAMKWHNPACVCSILYLLIHCLQQWKQILLSLLGLLRSQWRLQCIYGLNLCLHGCEKWHPCHPWLATKKGIWHLTWASNKHASVTKQMSNSLGFALSASLLRDWSCFH